MNGQLTSYIKLWIVTAWIALAPTLHVHAQMSMPQWQIAAGPTADFEVASVRPSEPDTFHPPTFPLSADDSYSPTHGVFFADFPLVVYIEFAYKLHLTPQLRDAMMKGLPEWAKKDHYTVRAHAGGEPTKDQMRLMVQSLLAERFHLTVHREQQEVSVLALTLTHPGKAGPALIVHRSGDSCDTSPATDKETPSQPRPPACGTFFAQMSPEHTLTIQSKNTTLSILADMFSSIGELGRPVVDQTGLLSRYDFKLSYAPEPGSPMLPPGAPGTSDANGPNFRRALEEQLGIRLKAVKATLDILMIDHLERPSEN